MRRNKSPNISLCWVVCPLGSKVLRFIGKQTVRAKAVEQGRSAWGEFKNCVELAAVQRRRGGNPVPGLTLPELQNCAWNRCQAAIQNWVGKSSKDTGCAGGCL